MGVAMMMQNAGMMVTQPPPMDQNAIRGEIRKAKVSFEIGKEIEREKRDR